MAVETRRSRIVLVALVAIHLVVISHQVDGGQGASLLERGIFGALYPFQWGVAASMRGVKGAFGSYVDLRGAHEENLRLQERLATAKPSCWKNRTGCRRRSVCERPWGYGRSSP